MSQLSAVMALKVQGRHYADNIGRCDIMFESFRHFKLRNMFSEILIVIPAAERPYIEKYAAAWMDFPIRLIVEDEYLDKFKNFTRIHEVRNWHRQQIIKMFCAELVQSEFFLVLDPDVFAVKSFVYEDVVVNGRAILESDNRMWHKDWWLASAQLLGVEAHLDRPGIGVTPAILSTQGCKELTRYISERYGKLWYEVLLSQYMVPWTEYTLYNLYLEHTGKFSEYHVNPADLGHTKRLHSPAPWGVWKSGDYERLNFPELMSNKNPGIFTVVQSNVGITPQRLARDLAPHIAIAIQPYEPSTAPMSRLKEAYGAALRRVIQLTSRNRLSSTAGK